MSSVCVISILERACQLKWETKGESIAAEMEGIIMKCRWDQGIQRQGQRESEREREREREREIVRGRVKDVLLLVPSNQVVYADDVVVGLRKGMSHFDVCVMRP